MGTVIGMFSVCSVEVPKFSDCTAARTAGSSEARLPPADTLTPTLGVRYQYADWSSWADVSYAPTPVPEQTGRTNYVDNDRVSGVMATEYPVEVLGTRFKLGAQLQVHHLLARHQQKLPTPTSPDGTPASPELVKDEVPDGSQLSGKDFAGSSGLQTNNPGC